METFFFQVLMDPEMVDGTPPAPCSRVWPGRVHLGLRRAHVGSRSLDKTSFPTLSFPPPAPPPSECFPVGRSICREVGTGLSWMVCPGFWGSQVPVWSSGQTDTCPRGQAGKGFPGWPAGSTSFMSLSLPCGHAPRVDQMALRALGLATLGQGWGTSVRMGVPGIPPRPVGGPRCWAWTFFAAEIRLFCHQVDADTILFSACRWRPWASGCTWGALGFRLLSKA